ncbi:MAG: response regulator [Thermoplasmatota archaeon]
MPPDRPATLLMVDDDEETLAAIVTVLRRYHPKARVVTALSGEAGLRILAEHHVDLIVAGVCVLIAAGVVVAVVRRK